MTLNTRRWVLVGMSACAAVISLVQRSPFVSGLAVVISGCCVWLIMSSVREP